MDENLMTHLKENYAEQVEIDTSEIGSGLQEFINEEIENKSHCVRLLKACSQGIVAPLITALRCPQLRKKSRSETFEKIKTLPKQPGTNGQTVLTKTMSSSSLPSSISNPESLANQQSVAETPFSDPSKPNLPSVEKAMTSPPPLDFSTLRTPSKKSKQKRSKTPQSAGGRVRSNTTNSNLPPLPQFTIPELRKPMVDTQFDDFIKNNKFNYLHEAPPIPPAGAAPSEPNLVMKKKKKKKTQQIKHHVVSEINLHAVQAYEGESDRYVSPRMTLNYGDTSEHIIPVVIPVKSPRSPREQEVPPLVIPIRQVVSDTLNEKPKSRPCSLDPSSVPLRSPRNYDSSPRKEGSPRKGDFSPRKSSSPRSLISPRKPVPSVDSAFANPFTKDKKRFIMDSSPANLNISPLISPRISPRASTDPPIPMHLLSNEENVSGSPRKKKSNLGWLKFDRKHVRKSESDSSGDSSSLHNSSDQISSLDKIYTKKSAALRQKKGEKEREKKREKEVKMRENLGEFLLQSIPNTWCIQVVLRANGTFTVRHRKSENAQNSLFPNKFELNWQADFEFDEEVSSLEAMFPKIVALTFQDEKVRYLLIL